jgi:hypothetical protein
MHALLDCSYRRDCGCLDFLAEQRHLDTNLDPDALVRSGRQSFAHHHATTRQAA